MAEDDEDANKKLIKERFLSNFKRGCDIDIDDIVISKR